MQNQTFGGDGGLTAACEAKHPDEPWLCFMSPHMQGEKRERICVCMHYARVGACRHVCTRRGMHTVCTCPGVW